MDGSNHSRIVPNLIKPFGLTIDFQNSRLYWRDASILKSSDMHGGDIKTVVQRPGNYGPKGIGLLAGRIYWTGHGQTLESCTMTGDDVRILHTGSGIFLQLAVVPRPDLPGTKRANHCENQCGDKVCVLTTASYKCLP